MPTDADAGTANREDEVDHDQAAHARTPRVDPPTQLVDERRTHEAEHRPGCADCERQRGDQHHAERPGGERSGVDAHEAARAVHPLQLVSEHPCQEHVEHQVDQPAVHERTRHEPPPLALGHAYLDDGEPAPHPAVAEQAVVDGRHTSSAGQRAT